VTAAPAFIVSISLEDEFLAFNRLVGVVRRRNLAIESLSIGTGRVAGLARVTIAVRAEEATVDRLVRQLRKVIGVYEAGAQQEADVSSRELVLIKVRATGARYAEVLDTAARFGAAVLEEGCDEVILEATGAAPMVLSLIRALEPYGVLDVARSGIVAVPRPSPAPAASVPNALRAIGAAH
jgi:acetolactate synthase-1/3 small subunit